MHFFLMNLRISGPFRSYRSLTSGMYSSNCLQCCLDALLAQQFAESVEYDAIADAQEEMEWRRYDALRQYGEEKECDRWNVCRGAIT